MKTKKFVSVLCACAMLLSALPFASAAEPLSEFAGQTIPVQAVEETEDGLVSRVIQVAIPKGATKAEEDALVYDAVFGASAAALSAQPRIAEIICNNHEEIRVLGDEIKVAEGVMRHDYSQIVVDFVVESFSGNTPLYVQARNLATGGRTDWDAMSPWTKPWRVIFYSSRFTMEANQNFEIYARTNGFDFVISACLVQGVY